MNYSALARRFRRPALFATLGALAGFGYYYFIGCASGTCPLSSNPWISTTYGMAVGILMTIGERKKSSTR